MRFLITGFFFISFINLAVAQSDSGLVEDIDKALSDSLLTQREFLGQTSHNKGCMSDHIKDKLAELLQ